MKLIDILLTFCRPHAGCVGLGDHSLGDLGLGQSSFFLRAQQFIEQCEHIAITFPAV
jgi:hypothetical protein